MTEETCIKRLITECKNRIPSLRKEFLRTRTTEEMQLALKKSNWVLVRRHRASYQYEYIRCFRCVPYKKELYGYVYTNENDTKVVNVVLQTE